jgi:hypothetical protein
VLVVIIEVVELGGEPEVYGGGVGGGTIQEQAEDTRDAILEHCDTKGGNPVVSVTIAVV